MKKFEEESEDLTDQEEIIAPDWRKRVTSER